MRMRRIYLMFVAFVLRGVWPAFGGEEFTPQPFGLERYQHIWAQSPFMVETPVVQTSSGLEQRFVLTGIATANARSVVFLFDRKSLTRLMVTAGAKDNPQNIQLVSVQPNADPKLASATIRLGAEQGTIHYDLAGLQAAPDPPKSTAAAEVARKGDSSANQAAPAASPSAPFSTRIIRRPAPINLNH